MVGSSASGCNEYKSDVEKYSSTFLSTVTKIALGFSNNAAVTSSNDVKGSYLDFVSKANLATYEPIGFTFIPVW